MKLFNILLIVVVVFQFVHAQGLPNDCINYIQVCGNYDINLDVSGAGEQEIGLNACNSYEHNSLWLHFTVASSGTLGFTITPESYSLEEDYDFWVFGPDVHCGNLRESIRCSTTNPSSAGLSYNLTGLQENSRDVSEGPGPHGDSFLQWLDVVEGEEYFLVIDRPIGQSAFQLTWTGSALLDNPLLNYTINSLEEIYLCDSDQNGLVSYDFSIWNEDLVNHTDGINITFHHSESDASYGSNPLTYPDEVSQGAYYARITHANSNCFEIVPISVVLDAFELSELEVVDNNTIIAHTHIQQTSGVEYSLDQGEWQSSNVFTHVSTGLHGVRMRYADCISDEMQTYVLNVNNVITPNGDGMNDVWFFPDLELFEGTTLHIYDRYGKQIFNASGQKPFIWDGTYNGRILPASTYWYEIILPDGRIQKGHITLKY